jgi:SHOCT-like protein
MDDERLRVLKMVEAGQITADEAAKLLDALQSSQGKAQARAAGRTLRVRAVDTSGRTLADVRLPLSVAQTLARAGIRLGALWSPHLGDDALSGILAAVESGQPGRVVQWAEGETGRQVEISVE